MLRYGLALAFAFLQFSIPLCAEPMSLPRPGGPSPVGVVHLTVKGESVLLWYPASGRTSAAAPYISKPTADDIIASEGYYEQSPATIREWQQLTTAAVEGAPPAKGRYPLIIILPGAGVFAFNYTAFAQDLASRGFFVAAVDYFSLHAPKRNYKDDDSAAMENDMAGAAVATLDHLAKDKPWSAFLDAKHVFVVGHSIGGAAGISAARLDGRIRGALDMDGAPFGESVKGATVPVLVLRSKPLYSDADLAKRGRTRAEFDKLGAEARKTWADFKQRSGKNYVEVLSISGTGHFSFSDAPFVMPNTITRFGGKIIEPGRGFDVISTCAREFVDAVRNGSESPQLKQCTTFPEVINPGDRQSAKH